jgi:phosphotransferase system IIB component
MTLREIREAYDQNYREMLELIMEMGGEGNIAYHRKCKTRLFIKLRNLQMIEHRLSNLEESINGND